MGVNTLYNISPIFAFVGTIQHLSLVEKFAPSSLCCFVCRKEHKSHSAACHFISLKKKVEDLTVEEFFKLQKERHKFIVVRFS